MVLDPATELAHGIYAVRYLRPDGSLHDGVASFGRRPTFDNGHVVLETFLFDFSGDLYGEAGLVSIYGHLRPELKFDSVEALVERMDQDSIDARALLERLPPNEIDRALQATWPQLAARFPTGR
jgi:riboflavin kinase/FMN adenylyltransferase